MQKVRLEKKKKVKAMLSCPVLLLFLCYTHVSRTLWSSGFLSRNSRISIRLWVYLREHKHRRVTHYPAHLLSQEMVSYSRPVTIITFSTNFTISGHDLGHFC